MKDAASYPTLRCLHHLLEAQSRSTPENGAIEYSGTRLSYAAFNSQANLLAHYLRSAGIVRGVRVAICLEPSIDFAIATFATLKAGGICVPLDPKYPSARLDYMLRDVDARIVISKAGLFPQYRDAGRTIDLSAIREQLGNQSTMAPDSTVTVDDPAYIIYTSGSTGKPRGVVLTHAGLANYLTSAVRYYAMRPGDRVLQFCSLSFDIAIEELFIAWLSGATLVFRTPSTPMAIPEFVDVIRRQRITVLDLPTAYWHEWTSQLPELAEPVPDILRLVIVGGEKALASALAAWRTAVGPKLRWVNTYGPSEASIAVTRFEPNLAPGSAVPANIPIGRPVENCQTYLLDPNLNPVPDGAAGELHIGGSCLAQEYFRRPELTAEKFVPNPFFSDASSRLYKTGDLARCLPDGNLEYLGRLDDQVKIRGFRVEPSEIEEALSAHHGVREAAVVVSNDAKRGKLLVAHVVLEAGSPVKDQLRDHLSRVLPDYMVPSAIVYTDSLPKTPNGKIDRRVLAEIPVTPHRSSYTERPRDEFEQKLLQLWERTLGFGPISVLDDFFEIGGHSLLAARLMHYVGRMLGKTVPLALLFEAPTVRQLAAVLRQPDWSQYKSCVVPIQPNGNRPSFFCVHGVGGNVLGFRELSRQMGSDYPFYGLQSRGLSGDSPLLDSVGAMAAHYIREIRSIQPEGPFFIGGYSFGGLVAYEMAQQLTAGAEEVALLALLDTYPGNLEPVGVSMLRLARSPWSLSLLRDLPSIAKASMQRRMKKIFLSPVLKRVLQSNHDASAKYQLRPYTGRIMLFRAEKFSLRSVDDPHAAWQDLAIGGLDIHEIAGGHGDILISPQVADLAQTLKACIEQASLARTADYLSEERALA